MSADAVATIQSRRLHVGPRNDQAEREKEQSEEESLVIGEYLDPREAEQFGKWRAEQEYVRAKDDVRNS